MAYDVYLPRVCRKAVCLKRFESDCTNKQAIAHNTRESVLSLEQAAFSLCLKRTATQSQRPTESPLSQDNRKAF